MIMTTSVKTDGWAHYDDHPICFLRLTDVYPIARDLDGVINYENDVNIKTEQTPVVLDF